jgi:putative transposase
MGFGVGREVAFRVAQRNSGTITEVLAIVEELLGDEPNYEFVVSLLENIQNLVSHGRVVGQDGNVLDILVQNRRDKAAARRFFRRLMKDTGTVARVVVTDKLRSYGAAHREVMPSVEHRSHKGLNYRVENSRQPTRQREHAMKGFRGIGGAQRFLSAFSGISPHFRPHRHLMTAPDHRAEMTIRFAIWDQITSAVGRPATV